MLEVPKGRRKRLRTCAGLCDNGGKKTEGGRKEEN